MKTIFYVGKPYPHKEALLQLKSAGYKLGLLQDPSVQLRNEDLFDCIVPLDFSSEQNFEQSLSQVVDLPPMDGLLCVYENYVIFKAIIADKLSLPSLSIDAARACTDKYLMRQLFLEHNPDITPEFTFVDSKERLLEFAEAVGYPLILKPTNLVKSLLVSKCNDEHELVTAYDKTVAQIEDVYRQQHITNRSPGIIVERFIQGRMCSVAAFADANGTAHLCDGIVDLVTAQDIGYDDNFLYARKLVNDHDHKLKENILRVAREGMEALDMRASPAHIEIIYNDTEVKLVEIGARTGGYRPFLYEQCYGIDMIEQEARIATGDTPNLNSDFKKFGAVYELFPRGESEFISLENAKQPNDYAYFHQVAHVGDVIGSAKDGYKAAAIIGITDSDPSSFNRQSDEAEHVKVVTR